MKQSTKKYLYSIGKTPLGLKGRVWSESSLQTVMHSVALEIVDLEKKVVWTLTYIILIWIFRVGQVANNLNS